MSERVVTEVARHKGIEPEELDQPLYDVIDPDILDQIYTARETRVMFEYSGYEVTATSSGAVTVDPVDA